MGIDRSNAPLSVVIIGVGGEDFEMMVSIPPPGTRYDFMFLLHLLESGLMEAVGRGGCCGPNLPLPCLTIV